jgi:predicted dehydrogenase
MKKLKIIQIGIQHEHAAGKMDTLRKMEDIFEVVGFVDDRPISKTPVYLLNQEEQLTLPYSGLPQFTLDEALNYPDLDAVLVEVPNNDLAEIALCCMKKGLPMHVDKPGGEDPVLFKKLIDGCKAAAIPLQMGYMYRCNPAMNFCRKLVQGDILGDILEIEMDMSHNYGGERYQHYLAGFNGGVMYNLGCHCIDFIISLLGRPENVTPFLKNVQGTLPGTLNNTLAVLEYPNTLVTVRVNAHKACGFSQRRLLVSGTVGTFELSPHECPDGNEPGAILRLKENVDEYKSGVTPLTFARQQDRYIDQLTEFAQIIRGEAAPSYSYEHDYLVHEVTLAAAGCTRWSK